MVDALWKACMFFSEWMCWIRRGGFLSFIPIAFIIESSLVMRLKAYWASLGILGGFLVPSPASLEHSQWCHTTFSCTSSLCNLFLGKKSEHGRCHSRSIREVGWPTYQGPCVLRDHRRQSRLKLMGETGVSVGHQSDVLRRLSLRLISSIKNDAKKRWELLLISQ